MVVVLVAVDVTRKYCFRKDARRYEIQYSLSHSLVPLVCIVLCSNRHTERVALHDMESHPVQIELHEKLPGVTSMEELLSCVRDINPDWSTVHNELLALDKLELAEKVYKQYILPKELRTLDIYMYY